MRKIKNNIIWITLSMFLVLMVGCDDVFEENISDDFVTIISPTEGFIIEGNTVQFSWQALDGADDYRVQVLNTVQTIILDSLVSNLSLNYILQPGDYQWRVKGENFAFATDFTFPINFSVQSSDDLSNQSVELLTPSTDFATNDSDIIFTWASLATAESYNLEIIRSTNVEETILQENGIITTSFNPDNSVLDEDAEYIWRVNAVNSNSTSLFSERSLFIDTVSPNQPNLISPNDMAVTDRIVSFNWGNGTDTGEVQSPINNSIEIASDIEFNSIISANTTPNNTFQFTFADIGNYFWRVKATDDAGNTSDYSIVRTITVE